MTYNWQYRVHGLPPAIGLEGCMFAAALVAPGCPFRYSLNSRRACVRAHIATFVSYFSFSERLQFSQLICHCTVQLSAALAAKHEAGAHQWVVDVDVLLVEYGIFDAGPWFGGWGVAKALPPPTAVFDLLQVLRQWSSQTARAQVNERWPVELLTGFGRVCWALHVPDCLFCLVPCCSAAGQGLPWCIGVNVERRA